MTGEPLDLEEWDAALAEAGPREDVAALAREARAELERLGAEVARLELERCRCKQPPEPDVVPGPGAGSDPYVEARPLKTRDQQDAQMLYQLLDLAQELNVGYMRLDQVHAQVGPLWARLLKWRDGQREPLPTVVPVPVELVASLGPVEPPDLPPTGYLPKSWESTTAIEGWTSIAAHRRAYADLLKALERAEAMEVRLMDYANGAGVGRLESLVFEALGAASTCWGPRPAGVFDSTRCAEVFDSTRCAEIGKELMTQIRLGLIDARRGAA